MDDVCPVCADTRYRIIGRPKINPIADGFIVCDHYIIQCLECGLYYVHPRIKFTDLHWSALYSAEYFDFQSRWLVKKRAEELCCRFDTAVSFLSTGEKINFLDIGTGEGKALIEGLRRGWAVTGIDVADNRISSAKISEIEFIHGKFLDHAFPENYYDFIYLDSVLEHVLHPLEYLHKIKQILKPNGIVYIAVPNEDCLFNDVRRLVFILTGRGAISAKIKPFDSPYHVIGFNDTSLRYLFNKLDFDITAMNNIGRKFNFLGAPIYHKAFWINLFFLLPIEFIGHFLKRDVYFEAFLKKKMD